MILSCQASEYWEREFWESKQMPQAGDIFYSPELGGEETNAIFVYIPAGTFFSTGVFKGEKPQTKAVIIPKGFYIAKYPLTNGQYEYMTSRYRKGHRDNNYPHSKMTVTNFTRHIRNQLNNKYRLPTNEEWEYAARGGVGFKFVLPGSNNWENVLPETCINNQTLVGLRRPNTYGLNDMCGNVTEITRDANNQYYHRDANCQTMEYLKSYGKSITTIQKNNFFEKHAFSSIGKLSIYLPDRTTLSGIRLVYNGEVK